METVFGTIMALVCLQMPDGGIGYLNDIIWKGLKGDMKGFVARTKHQVVVMGSNTFKSLKSIPLADRVNIVITTNPDQFKDIEGIYVVTSPLAALILARKMWPEKDICVIGGAQIYNTLFPYCNKLIATEVFGEKQADTFVERPEYFQEVPNSRVHGPDESINYFFVEYGNPTPFEIPMAA